MNDFGDIKDSGSRTQFESGAQRDIQIGKGRPSLVSPMVMRRLAQHMENGSIKYEERNWEKGMPLSQYYDSANRHLQDLLEGKTDEDHALAAFWNLHCFIHTRIMIARELLPAELDDMPDYTMEEDDVPD